MNDSSAAWLQTALLLPSKIVQKGNHPQVLSLCHPQLWKSGRSWHVALFCGFVDTGQIVLVFPLVKLRSLASLTLSRPQSLLYMTTAKCSKVCMCWDFPCNFWGSLVRALPGWSGWYLATSQRVWHSVTAMTELNSGSSRHLEMVPAGQREREWIGLSRIIPLPRQTHNWDSSSDEKKWMDRMTTSLSSVRTKATWWCWCATWVRWSIVLVSLWLHGWKPDTC